MCIVHSAFYLPCCVVSHFSDIHDFLTVSDLMIRLEVDLDDTIVKSDLLKKNY